MTIFSCTNINLSFGNLTIFDNLDINIYEKDKVGIVGVNGAGKTTFVKLLLGMLPPDKGNVFVSSKVEIGYLEQNSGLDSNNTVMDEFLLPFSHLIELENRIKSIERELQKENTDKIKLSNTLANLYEEYNVNGGNEYKNRVRSILQGLGFPEESWNMQISTLSGGQKTRLARARLLVRTPDVLVLDEPTNHLDTQSIEWLESFLKSYQGTLLVISHDRQLLTTVTTKTLLIDNQEAYVYNAPYDKYVELREADKAYQEKRYIQQQKEIDRIMAFVEQQKRWNRERNIIAAESRLKKLEKITLVEKPQDEMKINPINLKINYLGGKEVLVADNLSFGYTDEMLFENLSFKVFRGDRVFISGPNGCGKTTLLKILTGTLEGYNGNYKIGDGIEFAYYSQDMSDLNWENTIFDELYDNFDNVTPVEIRNSLAAFGFKGDDVFRKIGVLSGGEKARVQLLKTIYKNASFLILDEPTNHLDIYTREVLEDALLEFEGTILCVSHDRFFVNKIATSFIDMGNNEEADQKNEKDESAKLAYLKAKEERARQRRNKAQKERMENEMQKTGERIKVLEEKLHTIIDYEEIQKLYTECEELKKYLRQTEDEYLLLLEEDL